MSHSHRHLCLLWLSPTPSTSSPPPCPPAAHADVRAPRQTATTPPPWNRKANSPLPHKCHLRRQTGLPATASRRVAALPKVDPSPPLPHSIRSPGIPPLPASSRPG